MLSFNNRTMAVCLMLMTVPAMASVNIVPFYDLKKIYRVTDLKLTPQKRTRLGLTYIREEIRKPTLHPRDEGPGMDHAWVLARLVSAISGHPINPSVHDRADRALLWAELEKAPAGEYRDMLILALGLSGDRRVVKEVVAYMRDTGHLVHLKECAAKALGILGDPATIPALVDAMLHDPGYVIYPHPQWKSARYYLVRISARASLRLFQKHNIRIGLEAEEGIQHCIYRIPDEFQILELPLSVYQREN